MAIMIVASGNDTTGGVNVGALPGCEGATQGIAGKEIGRSVFAA